MPFTCAICALEIQVGEPMLSDDKMNLAHKICVDKATTVHLPSVTVSPLPPAPPTPQTSVELAKSVAFKVAHNIPVPIAEVRTLYEPCLMPSARAVCVECEKPAIAICPYCKSYVHQDFGYNGVNCSGRHEAHCDGARRSREPLKKVDGRSCSSKIEAVPDSPRSGNGAHRPKKKRNPRCSS